MRGLLTAGLHGPKDVSACRARLERESCSRLLSTHIFDTSRRLLYRLGVTQFLATSHVALLAGLVLHGPRLGVGWQGRQRPLPEAHS